MQKKGKHGLASAQALQKELGKTVTVLQKNATKNQNKRTKEEACQRFVKDLLVRGEAAKLTKQGKLPLNATHVITKEHKDGTVEVKRVRYKAF